ncbi:histidinol-phosphate transaminase [Gibbsiella quercinecans]|uniref:histidinol-phosphate transaminase n=1 Tax=Gibbsiella quercinecans TaxID=929813 RepID=UPI00242C1FE2|nr:histidinol-phosphate transaminase [Gibbsiella quercinecans]
METLSATAQAVRRLARQQASALGVYNAGLSSDAVRERYGVTDIARLASNENPLGASPQVQLALHASSRDSGVYPDPNSLALRAEIAGQTGVPSAQIVVGNGSENILEMLCLAFINPGDRVVTLLPSFGLHEIYPRMMGAEVTMVPVSGELEFDLAAWRQALQQPAKMVVFSNPSNPVGCMLGRDAFLQLIDAVPQDCLLVIDEAYYEYCAHEADYPDSLSLLPQQPRPWIVLRTCSKAYGLAGLRVGYGMACDAELIGLLDRVRTPFNINRSAQSAALAALRDRDHVAYSVAWVSTARSAMAAKLRDMGLKVAPSYANFLFFDCGHPSTEIAEALLAHGIIVKPWREPGYQQFLRVSIGSAEDNRRFLAALAQVLAAAQSQIKMA